MNSWFKSPMVISQSSRDLSSKLLITKFDYGVALLILLLIFSISISREYIEFQEFSKFSSTSSNLFVKNQYFKKDYSILELESESGFRFFSTTKTKIVSLKGYHISADIYLPDDFYFFTYLSSTYLFIGNISVISFQKDIRYKIGERIEASHNDSLIGEFYSALFLATPISRELRLDLSRLGVNHLVVLSGFHVGFILAVIIGISILIYRPIHQRYFPYRHRTRDVFIFSISILILYLIFIDSPPPFLRAVLMTILAFWLFDRNLIRDGFEVLIAIGLILIALNPKLLFSIGFGFSISGVFSILLFLKYYRGNSYLGFIYINIWVYLLMLPIIHTVFPTFYMSQLLSPIFTMLFPAFYFLATLLHLTPYPESLDPLLNYLLEFNRGDKEYYIQTPLPLLIIYISIGLYFAFKR